MAFRYRSGESVMVDTFAEVPIHAPATVDRGEFRNGVQTYVQVTLDEDFVIKAGTKFRVPAQAKHGVYRRAK